MNRICAEHITYGQTLAASILGGVASVPGTFAFTSPDTDPGAGMAYQSVTFTPDDAANYNTVVLTVSMTVNKATPVGTIPPTASAIAYGQTLASILSVAATSGPGRFAFTSPCTVPGFLGAANQSATFTPDDATDYGTALLTVRVTVAAPLPFWLWTAVNWITDAGGGLLVAPKAGRDLPNGMAYAFQSNLLPGEQCLVVRCLNGVPVVEAPLRGGSTLSDVCLFSGGQHGLDERDVVLAPRDVRIIYMMVPAPNALTREERELPATAKVGA